MNAFSRSEFLFFTILVAFIYIVLNALLPKELFIVLLNSVFFGVSISVLFVLSPLAIRAIKTHSFDRVSQLSTGIIITWISLIIIRMTNALSHSLNIQNQLSKSPLISVSTYLAILGGILYITAPGMADERLKYNREALAFSFAAGLVLAIITYYYQTG